MNADGLTLRITEVLPAPPPRVFAVMSEPDELAKWWGPEGFTTPRLELDLSPGGSYRIAMQPPEGELFYLTGEFREVERPTRLAYTFRWEEPDPDDQETLVTLSFADRGESTEVSLEQGPFLTDARLALHEQGWGESFEKLKRQLAPNR